LNLRYIAPELREDRGELAAAQNNRLPKLITDADLQSDLHVHSTYSDGRNTIEKMAKEKGVKIVISTDAHQVDHLLYRRYGIGQARRGWLEADDVANTKSLTQLRKLLKRG